MDSKNSEEILSQVSKINEAQSVRTSEILFAYKPTWQYASAFFWSIDLFSNSDSTHNREATEFEGLADNSRTT